MSKLRSQVSYLHGLAKGMGIKQQSSEGRLLLGVIEVLGKMSDEVHDLKASHDELLEYVEAMDQDLGDIEDEVYGDQFTEVACPACGETLMVQHGCFDDDDESELKCPQCGVCLSDGAAYRDRERELDGAHDAYESRHDGV